MGKAFRMSTHRLVQFHPPQITDFIIAEIVTKIVNNFDPDKIILFGSQVWGQAKEWSDLDLLIIMNFSGYSSQIAAKISMIAKPQFVPIDILVRTPKEIERRISIGDYFIRRILTEGKILYERRTC